MDEVKGGKIAQNKHTAEQIINKLRQVEVTQAKGATVPQAVKQVGVTEQTFYRRRKEYGGMRLDQAKQLKELEKENAGLKRLVADLSLDNQILKEPARGNFQAQPSDERPSVTYVRSSESVNDELAGYWVKPDRRRDGP